MRRWSERSFNGIVAFRRKRRCWNLQQIFPVTYKISRDDWKVIGIPELQGGKMQTAASHEADGEVERVVNAILAWVKSIDPDSIK